MKSSKELKDFYDEKYVESFELKQSPFRLQRLIKLMTIDKNHIVVDFACGSGMLMEFIAPKVKSYIGVDFSEAFIRAANKKKKRLSIHNAEFVCSDIIEFCAQNPNRFDIGFAMDFSEHVYDKEWLQILKAIKNSIKSNGKLYLHTPNGEFFIEKMKKKNFVLRQFPEHVAVRTPDENAKILQDAGFKVDKMMLIPHYNILRVLHPISYIPLIGRYFKARIFIEAIVP